MKRGLLKTYNLDSNRAVQSLLLQNDFEIRKRKPSILEERIRFRRQLLKNHRIVDNSSINSNDNEENSTLSRTSSDSSDNSIEKNRDSKQRVDLLDLELPKPTIVEKSKTLFKERIDHILSNNHRPRMKPRAKSAPCTPLFQIKCPKRNFHDFFTKNEGKEAPDDQNQTQEEKPIGNQLLISVMKESIGGIKDDLKSEEVTILEEEEPEVAAVAVAASEASQSFEIKEESKSDETQSGEPEELISKTDDQSEMILEYSMRGIEDSKIPFHRPGDNCCIHRSNIDSNPKSEEFQNRRITIMKKKLHEGCKTRVCELNDPNISPGCNCSLKSCRRSILRSRSTPRRVTFCVPSLIPEEGNLSDAEVEATTELREPAGSGSKSSRCSCSRRCCDKLDKAVRHPRGNNSTVGRFGENSARDSPSKTSLTDDKEWNVDWDEDRTQYPGDGISFPRETRLAMNVLMQSRNNSITTRSIPAVQKTQRCLHHSSRELKVLNKPDFGIFETAGEKAMVIVQNLYHHKSSN